MTNMRYDPDSHWGLYSLQHYNALTVSLHCYFNQSHSSFMETHIVILCDHIILYLMYHLLSTYVETCLVGLLPLLSEVATSSKVSPTARNLIWEEGVRLFPEIIFCANFTWKEEGYTLFLGIYLVWPGFLSRKITLFSENKFCVVLFKIAHSGSGSHVMGVHIRVRVHLSLWKLDAVVQEDHLDLKMFKVEIKI